MELVEFAEGLEAIGFPSPVSATPAIKNIPRKHHGGSL